MNKETYDPKKARFDLCESIVEKMADIQREINSAREAEMKFASNEDVDPGDFDNLKIKADELLHAIIVLGTDNLQ